MRPRLHARIGENNRDSEVTAQPMNAFSLRAHQQVAIAFRLLVEKVSWLKFRFFVLDVTTATAT